jgi:hypothetical protein
MAKRIAVKQGDAFLVPLEGNLKGVGRVLNINQATILIELYRIKPIIEVSEFKFDDAIKEKPISLKWCYDDGLKKGEWLIFENYPVEHEIEMPYYWTQDAWDKKFYISKGTFDSHKTYGDCIEIVEEDRQKYESYGIGNEISVRICI